MVPGFLIDHIRFSYSYRGSPSDHICQMFLFFNSDHLFNVADIGTLWKLATPPGSRVF